MITMTETKSRYDLKPDGLVFVYEDGKIIDVRFIREFHIKRFRKAVKP